MPATWSCCVCLTMSISYKSAPKAFGVNCVKEAEPKFKAWYKKK